MAKKRTAWERSYVFCQGINERYMPKKLRDFERAVEKYH